MGRLPVVGVVQHLRRNIAGKPASRQAIERALAEGSEGELIRAKLRQDRAWPMTGSIVDEWCWSFYVDDLESTELVPSETIAVLCHSLSER